MARTDAVNVINEVVARMVALEPRLKVTYEPGWQSRGNGMSPKYVGGLVHHTASNSSPSNPFPTQRVLRDGRPDLQGPLCNFGGPFCTPEAPWIHVMAAYPANHAGASGGRSMGPLPVTSSFNSYVLGLEVDYAGLTPMSAGQLYVAQLYARAVADVLAGGNLEYVRGHYETSVTGKWDPGYANGKSLDMNAFRAAARQITALKEDELPSFNDPIEWKTPEGRLVRFSFAEWLVYANYYAGQAATASQAALAQISGLTAAVSKLSEAVAAGRDDLTAADLRQAVRDGILDGGAAVRAATATASGPAAT